MHHLSLLSMNLSNKAKLTVHQQKVHSSLVVIASIHTNSPILCLCVCAQLNGVNVDHFVVINTSEASVTVSVCNLHGTLSTSSSSSSSGEQQQQHSSSCVLHPLCARCEQQQKRATRAPTINHIVALQHFRFFLHCHHRLIKVNTITHYYLIYHHFNFHFFFVQFDQKKVGFITFYLYTVARR